MTNPRGNERTVTRTYRAAVRLGEDYITLEETITLPVDASDEEVQQAVDLGWRIYRAQREAIEQQVASVREAQGPHPAIMVRDPDAPASEKQRNYIATLQDQLSWTSDQLAAFAGEHGVDLVTMTKGQASTFIDGLKRLAEERARYAVEPWPRGPEEVRAVSNGAPPATEKQLQALARLAHSRALDLDEELVRRFGVDSGALSADQARVLLGEWQSRSARAAGPRREPAPNEQREE
jgi:hypothetical protein